MIYVILFFLSELCDSYCIYRLIRGLSGECRVKHVWEVLCYPVYGLVTGAVYLFWNLPLLTMVSSMIVLFALTMLYDGKLTARIFYVFLVCGLLACSETVAMVVMGEAPMYAASENMQYANIFTVYLSRLIELFLFETIVKVGGRKKREFHFYQLGILFLIMAGCVYPEVVIYQEIFARKPFFVTITSVVILALVILIIWSYDMLTQQYQKAKKSDMLDMKNQVYKNELTILREQEEAVRRMRHDTKNHCLALRELARQGENEKVIKYLQQVLDNVESEHIWMQTGNPEMDGFVNYKFSQAQKLGITCSVDARIPRGLQLNEFDLAGILGNLLDNALEAAQGCTDAWIRLSLSYDKQVLNLLLSNSYQGKLKIRNGRLLTHKWDTSKHGYGMESMKRSVEKLQGQFMVEHTTDQFTVHVMLPIYHSADRESQG